MNKILILLAAVAYVHVARSQENVGAASPPPVPTGTETCTASVNGVQQTLQPGDRYCMDETTPRVCGFGQWYDQKCPEGFKCFDLDKCPNGPDGTTCEKPSKSFQVQCYQINRLTKSQATGESADNQRVRRQASPLTKTCTATVNGVQQTFKTDQRYCLSETTARVCAYGEWYDQECESGTKCYELDKCPVGPEGTTCDKPPEPRQVQCYKYNKAIRNRRQSNDTADNPAPAAPTTSDSCSANGKTFTDNQRYCMDETTPRVCAYGVWYDQKCPEGYKCFELDNCPNGPEGTTCKKPSVPFQVMCYKYNKAAPYPTGPPPGADGHRRRRQANNDTLVMSPPTTETCSASVNGVQQTLQPGDRYCMDETTPRVCGFGQWYDQKCPEGFKCFDLDKCPNGPDGTTCAKPSKPFQVQCYQINRLTKSQASDASADNQRSRRQANDTAAPAAPAAEGDSCSASIEGAQQTLKTGDRYCVDDTKHRVCAYGQWYDQECDAGFKCFQLDKCPNGPDGTTCKKPAEPWRVQCYKLTKGAAAASNGQQEGKETLRRLLRRR